MVNEWMARELNILPRHRKPFKGVCQAAGMVCIGPEWERWVRSTMGNDRWRNDCCPCERQRFQEWRRVGKGNESQAPMQETHPSWRYKCTEMMLDGTKVLLFLPAAVGKAHHCRLGLKAFCPWKPMGTLYRVVSNQCH